MTVDEGILIIIRTKKTLSDSELEDIQNKMRLDIYIVCIYITVGFEKTYLYKIWPVLFSVLQKPGFKHGTTFDNMPKSRKEEDIIRWDIVVKTPTRYPLFLPPPPSPLPTTTNVFFCTFILRIMQTNIEKGRESCNCPNKFVWECSYT